jgi:hypothetical protein
MTPPATNRTTRWWSGLVHDTEERPNSRLARPVPRSREMQGLTAPLTVHLPLAPQAGVMNPRHRILRILLHSRAPLTVVGRSKGVLSLTTMRSSRRRHVSDPPGGRRPGDWRRVGAVRASRRGQVALGPAADDVDGTRPTEQPLASERGVRDTTSPLALPAGANEPGASAQR